MKLLHIDAGITGPDSVSRQLSAAVVKALVRVDPASEVVHRDLDADPVPHLDSRNLAGLGDNEILQEFLDADVLVIGAPMYNFGMASQLKAWFDRIVVAGKTFRYTESGAEGLAGGKAVVLASARGGVYAPGTPHAAIDFHEPHLKALFGMVGIQDVTIIRAEGVALSPDHRAAALQDALASAPGMVAKLAPALAAA
jgi:FMN-dependent NADH-azoreductase